MFQVKATVIGFAGDEEKYPCHFQHKIGDEFIYDGEKYIGRICPGMSAAVVPKMMGFFAAGPRTIPPPMHYYVFWYSPVSRRDPSKKKYDGIGFRNVLRTEVEPHNSIANLKPTHAFDWPPIKQRTVALDTSVVTCGDTRTSMMMKIEAFDLAEKGDSTPYFRREMSILHKVLPKPGIKMSQILKEFAPDQIKEIYPSSLFSGTELNIDKEEGLNGVCDFLIAKSDIQYILTHPIIALVEAKNSNIYSGLGQCMAEMIAARLYNQKYNIDSKIIYGIVTTGSEWKFLTLEENTITIDNNEYFISDVNKLFGILVFIVKNA